MPEKPVFSVVMPAFNSAATIAESIDSIECQTVTSWELIVIDDRSMDDTCAIVAARAARDGRIRLVAQPTNQGAAAARNAGIAASRGRYVCFLDSDDVWLPIKLERQQAMFERHHPAVCFGSYYKMNEAGVRGRRIVRAPAVVTYRDLLRTSPIGCLTAAFDTEAVGRRQMPRLEMHPQAPIGTRSLKRIGHEDYAFWLQLLRGTPGGSPPVAMGIAEPIAVYRVRERSLSSNKLKAALFQWFIYREQEKLAWPVAAGYFLQYALHGFVKYLK